VTSLIKHMPVAQQKELLSSLNYLNMREFHDFCDRHGIPYSIVVETSTGRRKKTGDTDRKDIILRLRGERVPAMLHEA
jgi:hypothetical protein